MCNVVSQDSLDLPDQAVSQEALATLDLKASQASPGHQDLLVVLEMWASLDFLEKQV